MEEWGEAEFGVEDAVAGQLLKDIFNDDAEGVFSLHELEAAWRASEEVGKAGALVGGYEFGVVFGAGDVRGETGDGRVAERTVQVEVEFDFGERGHVENYRVIPRPLIPQKMRNEWGTVFLDYGVSVRASVALDILAVRWILSQLKGLPSMARLMVLKRTMEKTWR